MDDLTHDEQLEHPADQPDQPTAAVEDDAPLDEGTSEQEHLEQFTSLTLDDIEDERAREVAELRMKQLQGDYTRKTQELAEQRRAAEADLELISRLRDEESRQQALAELLDSLDLQLVEDDEAEDDDTVYEDDDPEDYDEIVDPAVAALQARLDEMESTRVEREQAIAQQLYNDQLVAHVSAGLQSWAETRGLEGGLDALSDHTKQSVFAHLATQNVGPGELPDVTAAIAAHEAHEAAVVQEYLKSKRTVTPDLAGQTGAPSVDLSDDRARRQHMEAVAARAIARHA